FNDQYKIRRSFMDLSRILRRVNCTTFMISEREEGANKYSVYGVEEFVVDGVIVLYFIKEKNMFMRALAVRKMRSTNHSTKIYPFKIAAPGGIKVYPSAEIFGDV
ncbi:MAG: ATPase domain-containing protein, partial [Candidatus Undinarchaeales archaeon]|nr:ATPase domain-containing protein [Candidatus Undinarchaeales archaeon]